MPRMWDLLKDDSKDILKQHQKQKHKKDLTPPKDDGPFKNVESQEEIDKLMRQPSRPRKLPK